MSTYKVMGHCPPDTDSTCSPIVYAWYLREFKNTDAQAYIGGAPNREAEFVLNHFGVETPELISEVAEGDKLVLVDTNNPEELIAGWDKAEIVEILDHHKLFGLKTPNPINVTIRNYGSMPTVLWERMYDAHNALPKHIAGLMLACLLSDTLKFTSPTTTEYDKQVGLKLAEIAGVDIDELAAGMFAAKSNLSGMSPRDVLLTDAKDFDYNGQVFKLAVLETTDPNQALAMRSELEAEMEILKQEEKLAGVLFFVVDIVKSEAKLFVTSDVEKQVAQKAFSANFDDTGIMHLPGVVSRKKQIAPVIEKAVLG
jgi:manganese-dependent inorganic pyrophosphatase